MPDLDNASYLMSEQRSIMDKALKESTILREQLSAFLRSVSHILQQEIKQEKHYYRKFLRLRTLMEEIMEKELEH